MRATNNRMLETENEDDSGTEPSKLAGARHTLRPKVWTAFLVVVFSAILIKLCVSWSKGREDAEATAGRAKRGAGGCLKGTEPNLSGSLSCISIAYYENQSFVETLSRKHRNGAVICHA